MIGWVCDGGSQLWFMWFKWVHGGDLWFKWFKCIFGIAIEKRVVAKHVIFLCGAKHEARNKGELK